MREKKKENIVELKIKMALDITDPVLGINWKNR